MLSTAQVRTGIPIGDDTHTLNALGNTHRFVENVTVCGDIHPTDIIRGVRDILDLYPRLVLSVFVLQAGVVIGHHLVELDARIYLCSHRRGAGQ